MKLSETYPMRLVCRLLGAPRSSMYYRPTPTPDAEATDTEVTDAEATESRHEPRSASG